MFMSPINGLDFIEGARVYEHCVTAALRTHFTFRSLPTSASIAQGFTGFLAGGTASGMS